MPAAAGGLVKSKVQRVGKSLLGAAACQLPEQRQRCGCAAGLAFSGMCVRRWHLRAQHRGSPKLDGWSHHGCQALGQCSFSLGGALGFCLPVSGTWPLRSIGIHLQRQAQQLGPLPLLTNLAPSWRFWRLTMENWCSMACSGKKILWTWSSLIFMRRCSGIFWAAPEAASKLEVHVGLASERNWEAGVEVECWQISVWVRCLGPGAGRCQGNAEAKRLDGKVWFALAPSQHCIELSTDRWSSGCQCPHPVWAVLHTGGCPTEPSWCLGESALCPPIRVWKPANVLGQKFSQWTWFELNPLCEESSLT